MPASSQESLHRVLQSLVVSLITALREPSISSVPAGHLSGLPATLGWPINDSLADELTMQKEDEDEDEDKGPMKTSK